jgi:formiminoglutamase
MSPVEISHGKLPIVLAMPHTSCYVPDEILETFTDSAKQLTDTDWNIHQLYDGLLPNATTVRAMFIAMSLMRTAAPRIPH